MRLYNDSNGYKELTTIGELEEYLTGYLPSGKVKIVNQNGNTASDSTPIDHFFRDSWSYEISNAKQFYRKINSNKTVSGTISEISNRMSIPSEAIRITDSSNKEVSGQKEIGNIL